MGNTSSETFAQSGCETDDLWWTNGTENHQNQTPLSEDICQIRQRRLALVAAKKKEMDELRKENEEMKTLLRQKNDSEKMPERTKSNSETVETERLKNQVTELRTQLENVNSVYNKEIEEYKAHVVALKDVVAVSKQLLMIREEENKQLSQKVSEIQDSLNQKEIEEFSDDIRKEYERQVKNMKQLKLLYEEKQRVDRTECNRLKRQLEEAIHTTKTLENKNSELEERVVELEKNNSDKYDSLRNLESQLGFSKAECAELHAEMSVINQLFSQILLGFNNGLEVDLDNLIKLLEENHDLLTNIVINEECAVMSSALPKLLLDLIHQVNAKDAIDEPPIITENEVSIQQNTISSAAEIVQNLPKVWRVLIELLSHQTTLKNDTNEECDKNPCYKSVETPSGPTLVLSVSKTFIRLKDLIVEKKSLEKETNRLKQLNTHLEVRLQDQEKRLEEVSHELANTWHVVGKMQKQHQQLHTHEKIVRYELSQKRKLLNQLKEELEYCKEKCVLAHEKNSSTEEQWKQLRNEFASRRLMVLNDDVNNSMESGYSDDRESSSDEDDCEKSSNPTILEVIKDEITKIEGGSETSKLATEESVTKCDFGSTYNILEQNVIEIIKQTQSRVEELEVSTNSSVKTDHDDSTQYSDSKTAEEILAGREERLKRLEEQAHQLVGKVVKNAERGNELCETLTKLHEKYGRSFEEGNEGDKEKNGF